MRTGPKLKRATLRQAVMVPLRVTLTHFYHSYNSVFNGGTGGSRTHEPLQCHCSALPTELQSQIERLATLGKPRVLTAAEYPTVHMAQG